MGKRGKWEEFAVVCSTMISRAPLIPGLHFLVEIRDMYSETIIKYIIQLNSCNLNSYNSNNHVIRTNFPVPSNFPIMYGNSYNSNNHVIRTNFSALWEFELHEFYCTYNSYFCSIWIQFRLHFLQLEPWIICQPPYLLFFRCIFMPQYTFLAFSFQIVHLFI